jgi:gliding motility-associated-like protein
MDDDGNGLIDINDPSCACPRGLIINESFEDTICCPTGPSQTNCLINWIQASDATPDYFNSCDFFNYYKFPTPPLPLINGNGFLGIYNKGESSNPYKEYIGVCLPTPLFKNENYRVTFYVGFGIVAPTTQHTSGEPIELSIFGNYDCNNLPFEGGKCPLDSDTPGWMELGKQIAFGENNWIKVEIEVSSITDINALVLGPSCFPSRGGYYYYFLDQISIVETNNSIPIELVSGSPCDPFGILQIESLSNVSYQWYLNGIAILGATQNELTVSEEGGYQVVLEANGECILSHPFDYTNMGDPIANLGEDRQFCSPKELVLGEENLGLEYLWATGETTAKLIIDEPGYYAVTVSNHCGETYSEVNIYPCEDCDMLLPNVFTPNNDGFNDTFGGYSDCPIEFYHLSIFSRWGEKVFESYDFFTPWDGIIRNKPATSDVYIWSLEYTVELNEELERFKKNGEVTLMR